MENVEYNTLSGENFVYTHAKRYNPKSISFAPHTHDNYELLMILHGKITYSVEGRVYNLRRGDIILSPPYVLHSLTPTSDEVYERYNVIFNEKSLPREVRDMIPRDVDVFRLEDYEKILELFEKIDFFATRFTGEALTKISENLITEAFYSLATHEIKDRNIAIDELVDKALLYINDNLDSIRNIDDICNVLYITKSHLHHIFVKHLHMSPKKYINSKKMMRARKLIRRGEKPTEIFTRCGYDDYATFYRNYKRYFGHAPSEEDTVLTAEEIRP